MTIDPNDPNIGRVLADRYELVELIGKGAMGRVYLAKHKRLGDMPVAVKFLSQTLLNDKMRKRFNIEASTCAQLGQKSIHIIRVIDFGEDQGIPFYVMEYLRGESLSEIINVQPIPLSRFLGLLRQICLGLQCAHQGIIVDGRPCPIIHRDIKPSNILVTQDGPDGELVKILDFGIAKLLQDDNGQTHSFMGTLAYSSPEQMEGRELDARTDIYSLGIMMFEMLTGKMPLQAETHAFGAWYKAHHFQAPRSFESVNPGLKRLPKALDSLVMGCLAKSPSDRPQSVSEILKALEPLEQRYSPSRDIGQRIGEVLARRPEPLTIPADPTPASLRRVPSTEEICRQTVWPPNRPAAKIVFPQPLSVGTGFLPAIWFMLPLEEIHILRVNRLYNRIYQIPLCARAPHPMILWATALYNRLSQRKPWWLQCYLDLKTVAGQEMVRLLGDKQQYQILLFGLDDPEHRCAHSISVKLSPAQVSRWQEWATISTGWISVGSPAMSRDVLKAELEKQKPRIERDFEENP
jgi:serine/threonine-protein kinase